MLVSPSRHIRPRQAREVLRAARHSYRTGRTLNWVVTIDFGWPDLGQELQPSRTFRTIRRRVCAWWDYKRKKGLVEGPICDLAVWEAPSGKHHVNWMMHIPEPLRDEAQVVIASRTRKVMGEHPADTLHQQAIYNLNGLLPYVVKGTEPGYAEKIGVTPADQGAIWFRRAVPSMSLGRAARERDWVNGRIVNDERARGLPFPREKRVMDRREAVVTS